MSSVPAAVLKAAVGQKLALEEVEVEAHLSGLLAEATLTQTYRNHEDTSIEAVYTFPLPLDAVLLELTLEMGDRRLTGVVQEKAQAATRYEEAIEDGDTAVLLERAGPGLYTVNVGNLQPGERAVIRFRYAQLLYWQGDTLRYHLPMTLAPRYGDPASAGLDPHQAPEYTLHADRGFRLSVTIEGPLASAAFECPSHPIVISGTDYRRELSLSGGHVQMDRDFVLVLKEPKGGHSEVLVAPEADGFVALAMFHPNLPAPKELAPRCLKLLVDCSGSMLGDSIAQAKIALMRIVEGLKPADQFNVVAFGSLTKRLFPRTVAASEDALGLARYFIECLEADMGGTELEQALEETFQCAHPPDSTADVLLITDGAVWDVGTLISAAKSSTHRIFTVGVGSAVTESPLRELSQMTGGACELVSPLEDMADHIVRHFRRIDQPAARDLQINWGCDPSNQAPERIKALYVGDTLHVVAWLPSRPSDKVSLQAELRDGRKLHASVSMCKPTYVSRQAALLRRIAAWKLSSEACNAKALDLALKYQLVTEQTSFILIDDRAENPPSISMPKLQKAAQAMPAGWSGVGILASCDLGFDYLQQPSFLRQNRQSVEYARRTDWSSINKIIDDLTNTFSSSLDAAQDITGIDDLTRLGLDEIASGKLRALVKRGYADRDVTWGFLRVLSLLQLSNQGEYPFGLPERILREALPQRLIFLILSEIFSDASL